jgi:N-acetylglucosamine-6-phosphate deacetylase
VTHTFNAMPQLHHRDIGIVGSALTDERLIAELIPDGVHVHGNAMRLLARARGWNGVALVTDSIGATGLPDGAYDFEEQHVVVHGGEARLADGILAGSTLTLDEGVRRFSKLADLPWHEAHASASLVPSRLLGAGRHAGEIAVTYDADLVAFDAERHVRWTMVGGDVVFRA